MVVNDLSKYNTLTIGSRTRSGIVGTTYYIIYGYYTNEDGDSISETIMKTTNTSSQKETFDISKYDRLMFDICCTQSGGSGWKSYYFNNIEILP